MKSIITITVEHGEDTDDLTRFCESLSTDNMYAYPDLSFVDYTVKVDVL